MPVIDSHHHFWHYTAEDYGWIPPEWSRIRHDFFPPDLATEIAAAGVDGVVTVQARQSLEETEWLLDLAGRHAFIRGVVGWAPLIDPAVESHLDRFATSPKLRSLRHVLQGESDDAYMLRADFNRGIAALTRRGLAYDILILERHLPVKSSSSTTSPNPASPPVNSNRGRATSANSPAAPTFPANFPAWSPRPTSPRGRRRNSNLTSTSSSKPSARVACSSAPTGQCVSPASATPAGKPP
jgi:hypothetical protein